MADLDPLGILNADLKKNEGSLRANEKVTRTYMYFGNYWILTKKSIIKIWDKMLKNVKKKKEKTEIRTFSKFIFIFRFFFELSDVYLAFVASLIITFLHNYYPYYAVFWFFEANWL